MLQEEEGEGRQWLREGLNLTLSFATAVRSSGKFEHSAKTVEGYVEVSVGGHPFDVTYAGATLTETVKEILICAFFDDDRESFYRPLHCRGVADARPSDGPSIFSNRVMFDLPREFHDAFCLGAYLCFDLCAV